MQFGIRRFGSRFTITLSPPDILFNCSIPITRVTLHIQMQQYAYSLSFHVTIGTKSTKGRNVLL